MRFLMKKKNSELQAYLLVWQRLRPKMGVINYKLYTWLCGNACKTRSIQHFTGVIAGR